MSDYQSISVYSNLALVFVEDEITKAYLNEIYRPNLALIRIENAGNLQNVRSLVDYHKDKQPCFGIVDRDYRWSKASKQGNIYMLSKHEIENYMLDAESIAQSTFNAKKRLSPDRISKRIDDFLEAKRMWFTCCYILAELNIRINQGFPHNPKLSEIQDSAAIVRYLAESKFDKRLDEVVQSINPSQINQLVNSAVQDIERIYVNPTLPPPQAKWLFLGIFGLPRWR